jgi:hypothetical protein
MLPRRAAGRLDCTASSLALFSALPTALAQRYGGAKRQQERASDAQHRHEQRYVAKQGSRVLQDGQHDRRRVQEQGADMLPCSIRLLVKPLLHDCPQFCPQRRRIMTNNGGHRREQNAGKSIAPHDGEWRRTILPGASKPSISGSTLCGTASAFRFADVGAAQLLVPYDPTLTWACRGHLASGHTSISPASTSVAGFARRALPRQPERIGRMGSGNP